MKVLGVRLLGVGVRRGPCTVGTSKKALLGVRSLTWVELRLLAVGTELGVGVDSSQVHVGAGVSEMLLVVAAVIDDGDIVELSPDTPIPFGKKGGDCSDGTSLAPGRMKDVSKLMSP